MATKILLSIMALVIISIAGAGWAGNTGPTTFVKKFYCKGMRNDVVELGYYSTGFYKKVRVHFIKNFRSMDGWTVKCCTSNGSEYREKMSPVLVKTEYVSRGELEKRLYYYEDQCVHTFTQRDGRLKSARSKRWGYSY